MHALRAHLVGELRYHDLLLAGGLFLLDDRPRPEDDGAAPLLVAFLDPIAAVDDPARREIGALDEPPQLLQRSVGLVDQVLDGLDRLAEVVRRDVGRHPDRDPRGAVDRSEEHTSELQSLAYLVCRLLLEKKKETMAGSPRDLPELS